MQIQLSNVTRTSNLDLVAIEKRKSVLASPRGFEPLLSP